MLGTLDSADFRVRLSGRHSARPARATGRYGSASRSRTEAPGPVHAADRRGETWTSSPGCTGLPGAAGRGSSRRCPRLALPTGADDLCGSLSKGLKQRASLARLAAQRARGDVPRRADVRAGPGGPAHDVIELGQPGCASAGVTVFLTTHRLDEAERLCDRVAILNTRLAGPSAPPDELAPDSVHQGSLAITTAAAARRAG